MGRAATLKSPTTIDLSRKASPQSCEEILANLPGGDIEDGLVLRLASQTSSDFFADIWAAIVVGTVCRRHYPNYKIIAWGQSDWHSDSAFAASLAGLTGIQMSDSVRTDVTNDPVDIDEIEFAISRRRGGILEPVSGKTRTLVEFDPQSSIAPRLRANNRFERSILFDNLILAFRRHLELGYKNFGRPINNEGEIKALTAFLRELHDNALRYSGAVSPKGLSLRGIRFLRLRGHLATKNDELAARARNSPAAREYFAGKSMLGVMEASRSQMHPKTPRWYVASDSKEVQIKILVSIWIGVRHG